MKSSILSLLFLTYALVGSAQLTKPNLAWRYHDIPDDRPEGVIIETVTGVDPEIIGAHQVFDESGEDWWYDIANIMEGGTQTGYITCGFATWTGLQFDETIAGGCENFRRGIEWNDAFGADCYRPVVTDEALSPKLMTLTKYDLNGAMVWCNAYCYAEEGAMSVIQSADGGFVFTGWGGLTRTKEGEVIPFNPYEGEPSFDLATADCSILTSKMIVGKVNSEGELLWLNQYAYNDIGEFGGLGEGGINKVIANRSIGYSLVERPYDSDDDEIYDSYAYRVVGRSQDLKPDLPAASAFYKIFVVDLTEDGFIIQKKLFGQDNYSSDAKEITRSGNKFFITGLQSLDKTLTEIKFDAILFKIDEELNHLNFGTATWDGDAGGANKAEVRYSTGTGSSNIGYDVTVLDNGKIAWAFLDDCNACASSGNNIAKGKINLYDESDPLATVNIDLGSVNTYSFANVHAFDLKIGLTQTSDGGFAVLTTIQANPINAAAAPYNSILANLDDLITEYACIPQVEYWNTDTYVAKFNENGTFLWDLAFDADQGGFEDYPGDWKQAECVYRITEATDGSLVIVGNASFNKDDYYIAKINSDCSLIKFNNDGYDISGHPTTHETTITTNTTWNTTFPGDNKSVVGSVVVKAGNTLTIDGITLEFADSRKMNITTNIIVEQGAKLRLINGAKLTSSSDCENSMWDGIQVWGYRNERQIPAYQGILEMDNATIENAIIGVAATARYGFTKVPEYAGGILKIEDSYFKNNLIGIEMRPTQNKDEFGNPIDNISFVRKTEFLIDGPLNDIEIANATNIFDPSNGSRRSEPRAHQEFILLDGIQGMRIEGSDFVLDETYGNTIKLDRKGYGILAWNSSVKVSSISAYIGDPSPDLNNFENLWVGIYSKPMGETANSTISGSVFDNNHIGVAFDGAVTNSKIINNRFNVRENSVFLAGDADLIHANTGVYLRTATSTTIEQNVFDGIDQNNMSVNTGIYVEDSYALEGSLEIYRNGFNSFDVTIQSSDLNDELFVDCNTFNNDITAGDVLAWHNASGGVVPNQGFCLGFLGPQANAFNGTYTGANRQILNQGTSFQYSHFNDAIFSLTNVVEVIAEPCAYSSPGNSTACPSKASPGDLPTLLAEIDDLNNQISVLQYEIETSTGNTEELQASLDYYTSLKIRQVDYAVRTYMDNNQIAQAIVLLENQQTIQAACEVLALLVQSKNAGKLDSNLVLIRTEADLAPSSDRSIHLYALCDFYELIYAIHSQTGGLDSISIAQIGALESLVSDNTAMSISAGNVLEYLELTPLKPLLLRPITSGGPQKPNTVPKEDIIYSIENQFMVFDLYPNPATDDVTIVFEETNEVLIEIFDMMGRMIFSERIESKQKKITLPLNSYQKGIYLVKLTTSDGKSGLKKLIIQ